MAGIIIQFHADLSELQDFVDRTTTKAGDQAFNPDTGATSLSRNHRYTLGAKTPSDGDVVILPASRGNRLRF